VHGIHAETKPDRTIYTQRVKIDEFLDKSDLQNVEPTLIIADF
jgi:hypothetical protein